MCLSLFVTDIWQTFALQRLKDSDNILSFVGLSQLPNSVNAVQKQHM